MKTACFIFVLSVIAQSVVAAPAAYGEPTPCESTAPTSIVTDVYPPASSEPTGTSQVASYSTEGPSDSSTPCESTAPTSIVTEVHPSAETTVCEESSVASESTESSLPTAYVPIEESSVASESSEPTPCSTEIVNPTGTDSTLPTDTYTAEGTLPTEVSNPTTTYGIYQPPSQSSAPEITIPVYEQEETASDTVIPVYEKEETASDSEAPYVQPKETHKKKCKPKTGTENAAHMIY